MEKFAARQTVDKAAHSGPLTSGSLDVTIGGFPAARQGDTFICELHGPGVIAEGSKTVTINGIPAARMGDITSCKVKSLPPGLGKKPAITHFVTPVKNTNPDGSARTAKPENVALRVLGIYTTQSDESDNNSFDQAKAGLTAMDFQLKNHPGEKNSGFDTNWGGVVGKLEGTAEVNDKEGEYGAGAKGRATGVSGNAGINSGKENSGDYAGVKAEGNVGYADGKIEGNIIIKPEDQKYGGSFDIGAEAAVAHGELEGAFESKYFAVKGTLGGSAGSVGAAAGLYISWDWDDLVLEVKASGKIALLLGLIADLSLRLGDYETEEKKSKNLTGLVLTGFPTVIIGG